MAHLQRMHSSVRLAGFTWMVLAFTLIHLSLILRGIRVYVMKGNACFVLLFRQKREPEC